MCIAKSLVGIRLSFCQIARSLNSFKKKTEFDCKISQNIFWIKLTFFFIKQTFWHQIWAKNTNRKRVYFYNQSFNGQRLKVPFNKRYRSSFVFFFVLKKELFSNGQKNLPWLSQQLVLNSVERPTKRNTNKFRTVWVLIQNF